MIPGLGPKNERPRLNRGADLTAVRLTPTEAFVLSRLDGVSSYEEICQMTGLRADETLEILRRLRGENVILGAQDVTPPPMPRPLRPTPVASPRSAPPTPPQGERTSLLERLDDHTPVDPAELASGPDLTFEIKTRIVRLHRRMKKLDAYELLGLRPGADKNEVKRAYFAASKEFHPDRYYGRDIGAFREKLGDIFARFTEAFQSLQHGATGAGKRR